MYKRQKKIQRVITIKLNRNNAKLCLAGRLWVELVECDYCGNASEVNSDKCKCSGMDLLPIPDISILCP